MQLYFTHPATRTFQVLNVTPQDVRRDGHVPVVDIGGGYLMIWNVRQQRPARQGEVTPPAGWSLVNGAYVRGTARAANPSYLNPYSLPWKYPGALIKDGNRWGYVHPMHGYQMPWAGWAGWPGKYQGRRLYDPSDCPGGTVTRHAPDGSKVCVPSPWYRTDWPMHWTGWKHRLRWDFYPYGGRGPWLNQPYPAQNPGSPRISMTNVPSLGYRSTMPLRQQPPR